MNNIKPKEIKINDFIVGGNRAFIIADIGSNHNQDLSVAKESIDAAAQAGVDAIKFQSIQLEELYYKPNQATASFIKKLEFPEEWHYILNKYCSERGILFFSTPTYLRSVDILEEINVPLYKLASAQIGTFPQIIERIAKLNKPTIFSTGISSYKEIIRAVEIFKKAGNEKFMILHCNSIYPTPPEKVNMKLMLTYRHMFGNPTGYSDHTIGTHISTSAVAIGANIIEKHFTLDRNLDTPDSNEFASDPQELTKLVMDIRAVEAASNGFEDRMEIQLEETSFKNSIIYRVVSKKDIKKGEYFTSSDIKFLRNENGIDVRSFYNYPNRLCAIKTIKKGELLTDSQFKFD